VTWERPERLNKLLDVDVYLRFAREEHEAMERFYEKVGHSFTAALEDMPSSTGTLKEMPPTSHIESRRTLDCCIDRCIPAL
jgi:hypothetical protein